MALKRDLSYFDLTNIVVGAIVGSDIYIASALTAGLVGPFSIIIWIVAGALATILALIFAYSSYYVPRVGGSFAFVSTAFNDFYGFLAGWSMWIAEVISLPVFAITFTNYLQYFVSLNVPEQIFIRGVFLFGLTVVNIFGVKAAGRLNDVLTVAKLSPLLLLALAGLSSVFYNPSFFSNYTPFAPFGFGNFGTALILIFWAYAGFELGTLPAAEVKNPRVTIPKAIITGMGIVTFFYLTTNFVIFGTVSSPQLSQTVVPLVLVGSALLFGTLGATIISAGALVSVSGSDESAILGTARLAYAMSIDGLFPKTFSKIHPRFKTPYSALIVQGVIAFALSTFSGLTSLISFAVFNLSFCFLLVSLSFFRLQRKSAKRMRGQRVLPWLGVGICCYLLYSTGLTDKIVGTVLVLVGIPLYIYFSPKIDVEDLKALFTSEEAVLARGLQKRHRFLANLVRMLAGVYSRMRKRNGSRLAV